MDDTKKQKSILEKIAPIILVVGLVFLGYFLFTKIQLSPQNQERVIPNVQMNQIPVDVDFLNSEAFRNLDFIPYPSIFDEVRGEIPSGREDPFAPIY